MIVKHLSVRGWFRLAEGASRKSSVQGFQSPRGEGVVQTLPLEGRLNEQLKFQSPRGEGVVQTKKDMFNFASTDQVSITSR